LGFKIICGRIDMKKISSGTGGEFLGGNGYFLHPIPQGDDPPLPGG